MWWPDQEDPRWGREALRGGRPRGLRDKLVLGGACLLIPMGNSPSLNEVIHDQSRRDNQRADCPTWSLDDDGGLSW